MNTNEPHRPNPPQKGLSSDGIARQFVQSQPPSIRTVSAEQPILTPPLPYLLSPPPHPLNLHIDRLTLHSFSALDRHRIGTAIQSELVRLFTEQGIPRSLAQGGTINQLDGGTFDMVVGMPPRVVGVRIARVIYRGLGHD